MITSYKNLIVWQKSIMLYVLVYKNKKRGVTIAN